MTKYHSKALYIDGRKFDSKKEARRYQELKLLERAGQIHGLRTQVKYVLIPSQRELPTERYTKGKNKGQYKPGKVIEKECAYYADFDYYAGSKHVVEDVKGMRTEVYKIKRKLMLYEYGIKIKEV